MTKREYQKARYRDWLQNFISVYCEINPAILEDVENENCELLIPSDVVKELQKLFIFAQVGKRLWFAYKTSVEGQIRMIPVFESENELAITLR